MSTPTLSDKHRAMLHESAISDEIIAETGYYSVSNSRALPEMFTGRQRELHGLVIPIRNVFGEIVNAQVRPDTPRQDQDGRDIKYESAMAGVQCINVPPRSRKHLRNPEVPLWFTEGRKKADSGLSNGIGCILSINGVWGWKSEGMTVPDLDEIAFRNRDVILAFDSDVMRKSSVLDALRRFARHLEFRGATVKYVIFEDLPDGSKCGLDDYFANGGNCLSIQGLIVDELPGGGDDWAQPTSLDPDHGPPFDPEILPGILGEFPAALAESTQTPIDLPSTFALAVVSAASAGKFVVVVDELDWEEPTQLYIVNALDSANRKSTAVNRVAAPIIDFEAKRSKEDELEHARWESRLRVLEKQLAQAENSEAKPEKPSDGKLTNGWLTREAAVEELLRHQAAEPRITQIVIDDATSEAAKKVMAGQGGAVAVISAESQFISVTAGRYNGGNSDLDLWTKGHAGDYVTVNRIGRRKERIKRATLTIGLAIQPHVLASLGGIEGFMEVGGAARILPSIPADILGTRKVDGITPMPAEVKQEWGEAITYLLERRPVIDDGCYIPWQIRLTPEALSEFLAFRRWHEPALGSSAPYRDVRDWFGKLPGAVLRLAANIHITLWAKPEEEPIEVDTLRRAICLGRYFADHARVMYAMMASATTQSLERVVLDTLVKSGQRVTTKRDLHRTLDRRRAFQKSSSLNAPLATLEDLGWIRRERQGKSEIIHVNPFAFESDSHSSNKDDPQWYGDNGDNSRPSEWSSTDPFAWDLKEAAA